jgi:hypothetical protein
MLNLLSVSVLLMLRIVRVLKSDVLVSASTGVTVVGRFMLRTSTSSVTKIDGLLSVISVSVNDSAGTNISRVTKYDEGENMQEVS